MFLFSYLLTRSFTVSKEMLSSVSIHTNTHTVGILFPNDGLCEEYNGTTEDECLKIPSKFQSDQSYCSWDGATEECVTRSPPTTIQFYMFVAILVTLMSIVPQVFCSSVLENICSMQPRAHFKTQSEAEDVQDFNRKYRRTKRRSSLGKAVIKSNVFNNQAELDQLNDMYSYYEYLTCEEEVNMILASVDAILSSVLVDCPYPWRLDGVICSDKGVNVQAIMEYIGVNPDGTPVPLTLAQRMLFRSPRKRVEWKIRKVRKQYRKIVEELSAYRVGEEDCMDTSLVQHFILEQLSPFNRYALKKEFFQFDSALPEVIDRSHWALGWALMIGIWLFLTYYVFQWAIVHSFITVKQWSYQMMFVLIQDVFVNQLLQIFIVHVLVLEALRPQLQQIYYTLNDIVVRKLEKRDPCDVSSESVPIVRACQHMSASCRAARVPALSSLPSSQLLMRIDDNDVSFCREKGRKTKLGWITTAIIAIPTALALTHDTIQESVLDIILPTFWSCFLIGNAYLYTVSPFAMVAPYVCIVAYLAYRYMYLKPRRSNGDADVGSKSPYVAMSRSFSTVNLSIDSALTQSSERYSPSPVSVDTTWRNMNLGLSVDPTVRIEAISEAEQAKSPVILRASSHLSDCLHNASLAGSFILPKRIHVEPAAGDRQSSKRFFGLTSAWSGKGKPALPAEVVSMRVAETNSKFKYREKKNKTFMSKLINQHMWRAESSTKKFEFLEEEEILEEMSQSDEGDVFEELGTESEDEETAGEREKDKDEVEASDAANDKYDEVSMEESCFTPDGLTMIRNGSVFGDSSRVSGGISELTGLSSQSSSVFGGVHSYDEESMTDTNSYLI